MVSECHRYIFGCLDALPSWIKIHQLILLQEMPEKFGHFKYLSNFFPHKSWWVVVECQASYMKISGSKPP